MSSINTFTGIKVRLKKGDLRTSFMVPTRIVISLALEIKPVLGEEGEGTLWNDLSKSSKKWFILPVVGTLQSTEHGKTTVIVKKRSGGTQLSFPADQSRTSGIRAKGSEEARAQPAPVWGRCTPCLPRACVGRGRASGSSCGRHGLGMGSSRGPRLPELQVNVTVLHPHGQTRHGWESLPQE